MILNRALAAAALVLALGAALAGTPRAQPGDGRVDELARQLESGEAYVDAVELGRWIRDRRPGLRILDLQPESDFVRYAIPTAEHATLSDAAALVDEGDVVVLYDGGSSESVRAWQLLRRLGYEALLLEGGLLGWLNGVMNPVLPAATSGQRRRYEEVAEVSRYFGGMPRVGFPETTSSNPDRTAEAVRLLTRRGCY